MRKTLFFYLSKEMILPFFIGLFGFIIFMVSEMLFILVDQVISKGLDLISFIKIIAYRIPAFLIIAIPVANLFAIINSITKLESNFEITSLRILGIRFYLIIFPFLVIGLFLSLVSFLLNETIVPLSMSASEKIVKEKIIKAPLAFLQSNVFFKLPDGKIIIIKEIDKNKGEMKYITLIDNNIGIYPRIITASKGIAKDFKIILYDGIITDISYKGFVKSQAKFEKLVIPLDISVDKITQELKTPWEMKYSELKQRVQEIEKIGLKDNYLKTQLYLKFSLPLSNIILILLSLPLAVMFARKGRFIGLFLSVFLIFFYYSSFSFFVALGKNNILNPFLAAFLADFIMLFAGIILIHILEK
ncbi:MAG: LptF/LptG family permease [bacterium]